MQSLLVVSLCAVLASCAVDDPEVGTSYDDLTSTNKLASNKLASNKLAAGKLGAQQLAIGALRGSSLLETADGRDVLSYMVRCALGPTATLSLASSTGTSYAFAGEIGLAPAWTSRALTVGEQRWVTACLLARTNYFGVQVDLSLRGDAPALAATATERAQYAAPEAAFYGNLFATPQTMYACLSIYKTVGVGSPSYNLRQCAVPSSDGVTTMCGFTYAGLCGFTDAGRAQACNRSPSPFGGCHPPRGLLALPTDTFAEVITVELLGTAAL
jgi:hypothetical protein